MSDRWYPVTEDSPAGGEDVYVRVMGLDGLRAASYVRRHYARMQWQPAPTTIKTAEPPMPELPVCPLTGARGRIRPAEEKVYVVFNLGNYLEHWMTPSLPTEREAIDAATAMCKALEPFAGERQ